MSSSMNALLRRTLAGIVLSSVSATGWLGACGPFWTPPPLTSVVIPLEIEQYEKGELGVIRPRYARLYLAKAYRVLTGTPPLPNIALGDVPPYIVATGSRSRSTHTR